MASSRKSRSSLPEAPTSSSPVETPPPELARVGVHARLTLSAGEAASVERVAYCPARERTVALPVCETCPKFSKLVDALDGPSVSCTPDLGAARRAREEILPKLDFQDLALRVHVAEAMTTVVVCVTPDAALDAVRSILVETDAACVPVVSPDGLLVGLVTHQTLLAAGAARTAGEIMAPTVLGVPESAPLAHAMATMAQAGVVALPVLAGDGSVVGVIGAVETLRFIVRRWGYETPAS